MRAGSPSAGSLNQPSPITRLIGMRLDEVRADLGTPDAEHPQGDDTWLIFRNPSFTLRIRCGGTPELVAASCTAALDSPTATLAEATRPLGLWPACEPDESAAAVSTPLVRRALTGTGGELLSMTATVRAGRFTQVTVFDEEPEWPSRE